MRIVAGEMKGRAIAAPEGSDTRPTTDRVREALFSSLYSLLGGFEGLRVLDAFAGSGALGIEALSRGAASALFCERDGKAASVLKRNLATCGLGSDRARVVVKDAFKAVPGGIGGACDLVFLDPPYAYDPADVIEFTDNLFEAGAAAQDAVVVYEHDAKRAGELAEAAAQRGFEVLSTKKYGKTSVAFLRRSSRG